MISKEKFSEENYEKVKAEAQKVYSTYKPVICNALQSRKVYFTSEGFNHLLYKNKRERDHKDQFMRLKVIDLAKQIIEITSTIQEQDRKLQDFQVKKHKKRVTETKMVRFWAFIAIVEGKKIKVIVRQVGNGSNHFWSVVPFWQTTEYGEIKFMDFTKSDLENE